MNDLLTKADKFFLRIYVTISQGHYLLHLVSWLTPDSYSWHYAL